jgi:tRNA/tmRNA/rRNA uracil-C5-methylase (TrmA/RlmC/RlmD family)
LARDLDKLLAANYQIAQIQPFDMFPQTEEVESVVLLCRQP